MVSGPGEFFFLLKVRLGGGYAGLSLLILGGAANNFRRRQFWTGLEWYKLYFLSQQNKNIKTFAFKKLHFQISFFIFFIFLFPDLLIYSNRLFCLPWVRFELTCTGCSNSWIESSTWHGWSSSCSSSSSSPSRGSRTAPTPSTSFHGGLYIGFLNELSPPKSWGYRYKPVDTIIHLSWKVVLKGQCHEIFDFYFFFIKHSTWVFWALSEQAKTVSRTLSFFRR